MLLRSWSSLSNLSFEDTVRRFGGKDMDTIIFSSDRTHVVRAIAFKRVTPGGVPENLKSKEGGAVRHKIIKWGRGVRNQNN